MNVASRRSRLLGRGGLIAISVAAVITVTSIVALRGGAEHEENGPRPDDAAEAGGRASSSSGAKPNVLVIVTDDQRRDSLSVMPSTRHLFRRGGTSFVNAFVTTPLCCPARVSIMTGLYAHNHGVTDNYLAEKLDHSTTMQRYLDDAGYQTAIVGKLMNFWPLTKNPPYFDRWTISPYSRYNGSRFNIEGSIRRIWRYSTDFMADTAVDYLRGFERTDSRPWFLYVATNAPHKPSTSEPEYEDARVPSWDGNPATFESDTSDKPSFVDRGISFEEGQTMRRDQLRTLMSVDDLVGEVFQTLSELGENRRTLAFFVSDNGVQWGEHRSFDKRLPYKKSIEIPILMRWPGHVEPHEQDPRMATNVDIAPTVMDAAGIMPDAAMDGRSLLDKWERDHVFVEYFVDPDPNFEVPTWVALRDRRRTYVEYYDEDGQTVTFREYYDLTGDPWELENIASISPESISEEMKSLSDTLTADRQCQGVTGEGSCP